MPIDLVTSKKQIQDELPKLQTSLQTTENHLTSLNLPSHPNNSRKGLSQLDEYRQNLHDMIDQHFDNLKLSYLSLVATLPCKETVDILKEYIDDINKQLKTYHEKFNKEVTEYDIQLYKGKRYADRSRRLEDLVNVLQPKVVSSVTFEEPEVIINEKVRSRLYHTMCEFITTSLYHKMPEQKEAEKQNKLFIDQDDYFKNPENPDRMLPSLNEEDKTLVLYSLTHNKSTSISLRQENELPSSPSMIITPDSVIYVCGGVLRDGKLTDKTTKFHIDNDTLDEVDHMIVKKAGHSLCYINGGIIYSIGGRTNDGVRTKICEKYDIKTNKWHRIANLNSARSRAAVCPFNNTSIYAFYGTGSDMLNVTSCEKYSVKSNSWTQIEVYNDFIGFEVSFAGAVQINNKQILVFGGFSENDRDTGSVNFSKKMMTFNINNLTFRTHEAQLPIDFSLSLSSTPVIHNQEVYCLGFFIKSLKPQTTRFLDCDYVLRIGAGDCEVKNLVHKEKKKNGSRFQSQIGGSP